MCEARLARSAAQVRTCTTVSECEAHTLHVIISHLSDGCDVRTWKWSIIVCDSVAEASRTKPLHHRRHQIWQALSLVVLTFSVSEICMCKSLCLLPAFNYVEMKSIQACLIDLQIDSITLHAAYAVDISNWCALPFLPPLYYKSSLCFEYDASKETYYYYYWWQPRLWCRSTMTERNWETEKATGCMFNRFAVSTAETIIQRAVYINKTVSDRQVRF